MLSVILFALGLICATTDIVLGKNVAETDLTLSELEKQSLDKFRGEVRHITQDEIDFQDTYLIRWLRVAKFDLARAEDKLFKALDWREKFKVNRIHFEDWAQFGEEYPYAMDSVDKANQSVVTISIGQWDIRQAIVAGQRDKFFRYFCKILDEVETSIALAQREGKFVTRGNSLINLDGYNMVQHACFQCIPLYLEVIYALDNYFPLLLDKIILVNTPTIFETLLNILKQAMSPETKKSLQVFGTNRAQWREYLRGMIEEDELPAEYGGNKIF